MKSGQFTYTFSVWPSQQWGHSKSLFVIFEAMGGRIELTLTESQFEQLRSDLSHDGFTLREIERVPYHEPQPVC
jgi:hypothetical protein